MRGTAGATVLQPDVLPRVNLYLEVYEDDPKDCYILILISRANHAPKGIHALHVVYI